MPERTRPSDRSRRIIEKQIRTIFRREERGPYHDLIDVAPSPVLARLKRAHDGWLVAQKWLVAWRFLEESQHPTRPQERQSRRWTQ